MAKPTSLVERVAMELRLMDYEHAQVILGPGQLTRQQTWDRCGRILQDGYRHDARRLLKVVLSDLRAKSPVPVDDEEDE